MKASFQGISAALVVAVFCFGNTGCFSGCGKSVQGHTYASSGDLVKIEFQSGGKASASIGPMTSSCTYTQDGDKITLICEDVTTDLTLESDGSLQGPPDGMLSKLTKVK